MFRSIAAVLGWSAISPLAALAIEFDFEKVVLDPHVGDVCYAVTAADVDGDGKLDAVATSEREVVWYQNPTWKKHVMITDAVPRDHVCIAAEDIDRDGNIDFALGAGWPQNGGDLFWLSRGNSLTVPWTVHPIGAERSTHRMRFADVLGRPQKQLVVSPLLAATGAGVRLLAYPIPDDPVTQAWQPVVIDGSLNKVHNQWHWPGDHGDRTIIASEEGLTMFNPIDGGFAAFRIVDEPSGEVKLGTLHGQTMLATIQPMHGNQVAVYLGDEIAAGMKRVVLDDTLVQGHAVWAADLDGDGNDEVIGGHREPKADGTPPGIDIYVAADRTGQTWHRSTLDRPMACEDVWCADFDGDGSIDILAGGRATHDVNLYLNRTTGL